MAAQQEQNSGTIMLRCLLGGISNATAGVATNPADVLKVRLQMQMAAPGSSGTGGTQRLSMLQMLQSVWRRDGVAGLMAGWQASVMREMSYSAIRMGLYEEVKMAISSGEDAASFPLWKKILAGGVSGGIGAALANPTDLLKVRAQALNAQTGQPFYSYENKWLGAILHIYKHEGGVRALYRGVVPTTQRAVILTATQFSSYDEAKQILLQQGLLAEGPAAHAVASTLAGLAVATTTNPIDLIKSRYMNQAFDSATGRGRSYSGVADCLVKTVRSEGILGLYKGWLPNWLRIGPHTVVTFMCFEALRKFAGIRAV